MITYRNIPSILYKLCHFYYGNVMDESMVTFALQRKVYHHLTTLNNLPFVPLETTIM